MAGRPLILAHSSAAHRVPYSILKNRVGRPSAVPAPVLRTWPSGLSKVPGGSVARSGSAREPRLASPRRLAVFRQLTAARPAASGRRASSQLLANPPARRPRPQASGDIEPGPRKHGSGRAGRCMGKWRAGDAPRRRDGGVLSPSLSPPQRPVACQWPRRRCTRVTASRLPLKTIQCKDATSLRSGRFI